MLPSLQTYKDYILEPEIAFQGLNSSLAASTPVFVGNTDKLHFVAGGQAVIFKMQNKAGEYFGLRCFKRLCEEKLDRYRKIHRHLIDHPCVNYFIPFQFLEQGIRVDGRVYPVVRMKWLEGITLKRWLNNNLSDSKRLTEMVCLFGEMVESLNENYLVHGDLHHSNIMVEENDQKTLQLRLIDYDTLFFADREQFMRQSTSGYADFQHPSRKHYTNIEICTDYFSQYVLFLSLLGLAEDPSRWNRYGCEESDALLFREADFKNPDAAPIFCELATSTLKPLRETVTGLQKLCRVQTLEHIPCPCFPYRKTIKTALYLAKEEKCKKKKNISPQRGAYKYQYGTRIKYSCSDSQDASSSVNAPSLKPHSRQSDFFNRCVSSPSNPCVPVVPSSKSSTILSIYPIKIWLERCLKLILLKYLSWLLQAIIYLQIVCTVVFAWAAILYAIIYLCGGEIKFLDSGAIFLKIILDNYGLHDYILALLYFLVSMAVLTSLGLLEKFRTMNPLSPAASNYERAKSKSRCI